MSKIITLVLNPFTIDLDAHSENNAIKCEDQSLTRQSEVEQSDINFIVKQFGLTHQLPYGNSTPFYDDISDIPTDYQTALNLVEKLDSSFMEYPAEIRAQFGNNPQKLLEFIQDSNNYDQAVELGLIPRAEVTALMPSASAEEASPKGAQEAQS